MYPYLEDERDPSVWDVDYVAFDLETTGLTHAAEICEIGACRFSLDDDRLERFSTLVRPKAEIPWDATEVHGITNEMVRHAPRLEEVLPAFGDFLLDGVLVAHNASFDLRYLRERLKLPNHVVDTYKLARRWLPATNGYALGSLVEVKRWHRALPDSEACALLLRTIISEMRTKRPKGEPILLSEITVRN